MNVVILYWLLAVHGVWRSSIPRFSVLIVCGGRMLYKHIHRRCYCKVQVSVFCFTVSLFLLLLLFWSYLLSSHPFRRLKSACNKLIALCALSDVVHQVHNFAGIYYRLNFSLDKLLKLYKRSPVDWAFPAKYVALFRWILLNLVLSSESYTWKSRKIYFHFIIDNTKRCPFRWNYACVPHCNRSIAVGLFSKFLLNKEW